MGLDPQGTLTYRRKEETDKPITVCRSKLGVGANLAPLVDRTRGGTNTISQIFAAILPEFSQISRPLSRAIAH